MRNPLHLLLVSALLPSAYTTSSQGATSPSFSKPGHVVSHEKVINSTLPTTNFAAESVVETHKDGRSSDEGLQEAEDADETTPAGGKLYVLKRNGSKEPIFYDKIQTRIKSLATNLSPHVDIAGITQRVVTGLYPGIKTSELDNLAAETAAYMSTQHPDYSRLAARISVSNLHKETNPSFSKTLMTLATLVDPQTSQHCEIISPELMKIVSKYSSLIDSKIDSTRDYRLGYFGFKTLEKSYLLKEINTKETLERPQYMWMRVALGIHCRDIEGRSKADVAEDLEKAFETYDLMSQGYFTHASPTLFHSGTTHPQLSSCFLLKMKDDSITGIYDTLKSCATISKGAGGIGLSVSNIRARGSYIKGTKGYSNGLVPMLRVFDSTSRYVDQGGGKRPGAFAVYLEPWHADVEDWLDLKKNHGKEERRARDLFYGLWICDEFMRRVEEDGEWSLMCPNACPGLTDCHGKEFDELYRKYEKEGKFIKTIRARELWQKILSSQVETGTPYMCYKDSANSKSNQQNLGTIKSSNLCTEIIEYTDDDEIAVCNLASVCLSRFVESDRGEYGSPDKPGQATFNFEKLHSVVKVMTRNLNRIIDVNSYPLPAASNSNNKHRPIGLGVSGLADALIRMGHDFDGEEGRKLNAMIFECMYHASLEASCEIAERDGVYESYEGSPISKGKLQFDLWENVPESVGELYDWSELRGKIAKHGVRNSLLVAPMPTASTSQILGVNECIEPYTSNLYTRRVKAGEFIIANPHLLRDLSDRGLWNSKVKNELIKNNGSVQNLKGVPSRLKKLYRTVWEIPMRGVIDMASDRGAFVCQSQSLNLFLENPTQSKLSAMHFYGWKKGLKTGMYYLRTKGAADAIQFTVEEEGDEGDEGDEGGEEDDAGCLSCQG